MKYEHEWLVSAVLIGDVLVFRGPVGELGDAHNCSTMCCGSVQDPRHVLARFHLGKDKAEYLRVA